MSSLAFSRALRVLRHAPLASFILASAFTAGASPAAKAAADSPVGALIGAWRGDARATMDSGKTENMQCKGYYTAQGGDGLGIAIRCANASAKVDLRATLAFSNGSVSGNWEERTYNASGAVSGKATANKVNLAINGGGLTAAMTVSITGASHSVAISTQGTGLKGVNINFNRG